MKEEFLELYHNFVDDAKEKNGKILLDFKNTGKEFASKEILSLWVSECLIEDIGTIQHLKDNSFSNRYVDAIIRNMCEQVIEYLYIMKHQELIPIFFGRNLKEDFDEQKDLFAAFKQTGQARFGKRKPVKEMAKDIGEEKSSDDKLSLYDIYSIKAELEHNSYFHHRFDIIGEIEDDEKEEDDLDYMFMLYILNAFLDAYYK